MKKQTTLKTTLPVKTEAILENLKTVSDFVRMFAAAKIPFNVADNPQNSTCNQYDKFENICAFTTDNAPYMRSAWNNCLKAVFPDAIHISFIAHVMNIIIRDFIEPFEQITDWASKLSSYFVNSGYEKKSIFGLSEVNWGAPKNASKTNTDTMDIYI